MSACAISASRSRARPSSSRRRAARSGAAVGQIAKIGGARTIGIAGGKEKCAFVREALGFDAAIDHRAPDLAAQLAKACPKGIDVYFENVGGHVWDAVFPLLNNFARIPVCGLIAQYNDVPPFPGPDRFPVVMDDVLSKRFHIQGFIQFDFAEQRPDFYRDMAQWIREGRVKYREDIIDGLENAPEGLIGLLQGKNFGKLIVRVADLILRLRIERQIGVAVIDAHPMQLGRHLGAVMGAVVEHLHQRKLAGMLARRGRGADGGSAPSRPASPSAACARFRAA